MIPLAHHKLRKDDEVRVRGERSAGTRCGPHVFTERHCQRAKVIAIAKTSTAGAQQKGAIRRLRLRPLAKAEVRRRDHGCSERVQVKDENQSRMHLTAARSANRHELRTDAHGLLACAASAMRRVFVLRDENGWQDTLRNAKLI